MNPKDTNLVISNDDIQFISDKYLINRKLQLLNMISERLKSLSLQLSEQSISWEIDKKYLKVAGKISKGENHNGYPYLILDYPRNFQRSNILAFRNLFWWGNFYSTTLHISGIDQLNVIEQLFQKRSELVENKFMINKTGSEWENTPDSFISIEKIEDFQDYLVNQLRNGEPIRIMRLLDLNKINELESFTLKNSELLFSKEN